MTYFNKFNDSVHHTGFHDGSTFSAGHAQLFHYVDGEFPMFTPSFTLGTNQT